jgi:hypothetical protein
MSEIFAVQLTAVATLALALLALATAILALLAWRKQSREVSDQGEMLRQATADRDREALERHRAQAVQVYLEELVAPPPYDLDPYVVAARVRNTSQQPVYGLRYQWHVNDQPVGNQIWRGSLMPGTEDKVIFECPADVRPARVTAMVIFRDRAGTWWSIWADGRLEEVPPPPQPSWAIRSAASTAAKEAPPDAGEQSP